MKGVPQPDGRVMVPREPSAAMLAAAYAAENSELRADNIRLQNEVVGPLRERVKEVEVESLAFVYERNEAQERVHALAGRVKVLEDALGGLLFAEQDECTLENYAAASEAARAALGDKP